MHKKIIMRQNSYINRLSRWCPLALLALIVSCSESSDPNLILADRELREPSAEEQQFIDLAKNAWAEKLGYDSVQDASSGMRPEIRSTKSEICVTLKLEPVALGGEPTYCYSRSTGEMVRKDDDVE